MTLASPLKTVTQSNSVIYKGGQGRTEKVKANGTDLFLTAIVTKYGETAPDVDLCGSGEPISGVITGEYSPYKIDLDKDSDDPYDDDDDLQMYIPQDGDQLYLTVKTNTAISYGDWVKVDGGFVDSGAKADAFGRCVEPDGISAVSGTETVALFEWGVDA